MKVEFYDQRCPPAVYKFGEQGMCFHYIPDAESRCMICYPKIKSVETFEP